MTETDWETRARTAEARVRELADERARLWEEVQQLRARSAASSCTRASAVCARVSQSVSVTGPQRCAVPGG